MSNKLDQNALDWIEAVNISPNSFNESQLVELMEADGMDSISIKNVLKEVQSLLISDNQQ